MAALHRISEADVPAALTLLASSGGTARTLDSWRQDQMTALALGDPAAPTAVMPLARRTIRVAPGRTLAAGWLSSNQFAARMSFRRQTRDTAPDWAALLPEVDALVVLRRDEPSLAARWYARTGFEEVLSVRCLYLDMDAPPSPTAAGTGAWAAGGAGGPGAGGRYLVQVATPGAQDPGWAADAGRWQAEMAAVYQAVYGTYGGPPPRPPGFWGPALAHHYYREHYQFQILGLWNSAAAAPGNLLGYAVVGWSGWHSKRPRMDILELATRQWDTAVATDLLHTTCQLAWSKNVRQVRAVISAHDPYRGHLHRTGFQDRWGYLLLAKWLHPQRYLDRLAQTLPAELAPFTLQVAAPQSGHLPLSLRLPGPVPGQATPLALQAAPKTLARLLLNRLDVAAALQEGTLTPAPPGHPAEADLARLSLAFPWTPWAFHMLDYI